MFPHYRLTDELTCSRVFGLTILYPKTPTLTGCQVERGLGAKTQIKENS